MWCSAGWLRQGDPAAAVVALATGAADSDASWGDAVATVEQAYDSLLRRVSQDLETAVAAEIYLGALVREGLAQPGQLWQTVRMEFTFFSRSSFLFIMDVIILGLFSSESDLLFSKQIQRQGDVAERHRWLLASEEWLTPPMPPAEENHSGPDGAWVLALHKAWVKMGDEDRAADLLVNTH